MAARDSGWIARSPGHRARPPKDSIHRSNSAPRRRGSGKSIALRPAPHPMSLDFRLSIAGRDAQKHSNSRAAATPLTSASGIRPPTETAKWVQRILLARIARLYREGGLRRGRVAEVVGDLDGERVFTWRVAGQLHE